MCLREEILEAQARCSPTDLGPGNYDTRQLTCVTRMCILTSDSLERIRVQ